jgi:hypothetical protein
MLFHKYYILITWKNFVEKNKCFKYNKIVEEWRNTNEHFC